MVRIFWWLFFGLVLMRCISVRIMIISVRQNVFFQHVSQPFLKMRKFLLDMRKDFLIMSNFYLVEILSEPNSLTIVTSKKIFKVSNYMLTFSIFFLITRIRNLQCRNDDSLSVLYRWSLEVQLLLTRLSTF